MKWIALFSMPSAYDLAGCFFSRSRPSAEVQSIFWLLRAFLRLETERMRQRGVRLKFIGRRDWLEPNVLKAMESTERITAEGSRLLVCAAIDYSSRQAIVQAALDAADCLSGRGINREISSADSLRSGMAGAIATVTEDVDS